MYKNKLKTVREEKNLKQKDIANIIQVTESTYCNFENEHDIVPIKRLITLADYYQVSIDYLFDLNTQRNYHNSKLDCDINLMSIRLKEFRKDNKLTQVKLSNTLKVAKGTFANYECKRNIIATSFLYEICTKYNISADYLLGRVDNPKYLK